MRIFSPPFLKLFCRIHPEKGGSAIVIVLILIFLVSAVLLAFMAQSILERASSHNYAQAIRVQEIADAASSLIIEDFRNEIEDASTVSGNSTLGFTYTPKSRSAILPQLSGVLPSDAIPNLIKKSDRNSFLFTPTGTGQSLLKASASSTSSTSSNGRSVALSRWNAPFLMGTSIPSTFTAPDWILLSRGGPITSTALTKEQSDRAYPGSNKYVVGRFAYTIYDEGETLDVNVAGHPNSGLSPNFTGFRRSTAQADLKQIPGIDDDALDKIITWRNRATASSFESSILNNTNGFLKAAPGDDSLLSRQDLIRFWNTNSLDKRALPYLGTFSREMNSPSWQPDRNMAAPYNYYTISNQATATNPNLPAVRNPTGNADAGKVMLKKRFLLSRLSWLTPDGPATGRAADIRKYFGLEWNSAGHQWIYKSPSGAAAATSIKKLSEIEASRTDGPDFFELIQAAILDGSLGKSAGSATVLSNCDSPDSRADYQVMRIAANIMDQYDTDSFPTILNYQGQEFYGTENLPYLNEVFIKFFDQSATPTARKISPFLLFEFWNPHDQNESGTPAAGQIPTQVRMRINSGAIKIEGGTLPTPTTPFVFNGLQRITLDQAEFPQYSEPHIPTAPAIAGLNMAGISIANSGEFPRNEITFGWWFFRIESPIMIVMEYKDSSGVFRPYSTFTGLRTLPVTGVSEVTAQNWTDDEAGVNQSMVCPITYYYDSERAEDFDSTNPGKHSLMKSDPRTPRFGVSASSRKRAWGPDPYLIGKYNSSLRPRRTSGALPPDGGTTYDANGFVAQYSKPSWFPGQNINFFPALMAQNTVSGQIYSDRDGVARRGDYAASPNASADVNPFETLAGAPRAEDRDCRPVILNRPFKSVGELGYVFRDLPWKTIDLFSNDSADLALLDIFTLDDSPVVAGKVSANTRNKPVLMALLNGAAKTNVGATISNAGQVADQILSFTGSRSSVATLPSDPTVKGPLLNKSQLGAYALSSLNIGNAEENLIKKQREASARALADVTQTRTWNLLIDLVAQAGSYPQGMTSLDQFRVEGERRLWIHIAIDRFTGEVVDRQVETVYE